MKPVEWLKPYERNAKLHPDDQIRRLSDAIKASGWDQPIVTEADGTIIKGHGRRLAAIKLGLTHVPVIVRYDLSKAQADAARISDNAAVGLQFDTGMMQDEIRRIMNDIPEFDVDAFALTDKERTLLLKDLTIESIDAIMEDTATEIENQKNEDRERVAKADAEDVSLAKALGFSKIKKADERLLVNFLAEAEETTGKEGYDAFIAGLRIVVERGLAQ